MIGKKHVYTAKVTWPSASAEGPSAEGPSVEGPPSARPSSAGTADYASYSRRHHIQIAGKADLLGSADPIFRGEGTLHNPEDLFLAAIAACHMLTYLALCARRGVRVVAYEDQATATMGLAPTGGGGFEEVTLCPVVTVVNPEVAELARGLHELAHEHCIIASSCSVPIRCRPTIEVVGVVEVAPSESGRARP